MIKKIAFYFLLLAFFAAGAAHAGVTVIRSVNVSAPGGGSKTSTLDVAVKNGSSITGTLSSGNVISFAQYLEVKFSCTLDDFQAIIISTNNSDPSASPQYSGGGTGSGLVNTINTVQNVPLHWVVFPTAQAGGYTFVPGADPNAEPIQTSNQFFVADKRENPFPAGYASFTYDLDTYTGRLADAPTTNRTTTNGTIYIYLATNLKDVPAGQYKTSLLTIELVTIHANNTYTVHQRRTFTVTANK